jgi:pyruvate,water dikinase
MLNSGNHLSPADRKQYHALFINGRFQVFWGSWGVVQQKIEGIAEIKGIIACKGYAKGVVKIVNDLPDLKKFERGDILIAPYTNPNMVPAMEKAAAIVTNIGGMTSHAAIVSRELNKPCIIGTQNATQILSDGDIVEVDANVGTVRILR